MIFFQINCYNFFKLCAFFVHFCLRGRARCAQRQDRIFFINCTLSQGCDFFRIKKRPILRCFTAIFPRCTPYFLHLLDAENLLFWSFKQKYIRCFSPYRQGLRLRKIWCEIALNVLDASTLSPQKTFYMAIPSHTIEIRID